VDPISQGSLGAVIPGSIWGPKQYRVAVLLGCLAGLAPDLDVLIQSSTDPLLFLEYHRQFTHALMFIPIGALVIASVCYPVVRRWLSFTQAYLACLLGYATHGFLDACTTYGTQLFWPFTNFRVSWNVVSVLDPMFTIPLLVIVIVATVKRKRAIAWFGLGWTVIYLTFGAFQHQRAMDEGMEIALGMEHSPAMLSAKPTIANLIAWKVVYLHDGVFYAHAVHTGFDTKRCGSVSAPQLDVSSQFPWLDEKSQQAEDVKRFSWFSQDYVAVDPTNPNKIIDMRYTFAPNKLEALWGIELDRNLGLTEHAKYFTNREVNPELTEALLDVITGDSCESATTGPQS